MGHSEIILAQLKRQKLLPLFYHNDAAICIEVVKALYAGGVRSVEFTNRGAAALENFKAIVAERNNNMKDLLLAVGTIRTPEQVDQFTAAGADFLISPVFDKAIGDAAFSSKILWIPGCMTPTEIHMAEKAGCEIIKLFPGNVLGPSFVTAVKELFPKLSFIITGGVEPTKENLCEWLSAGAVAAGIGSKLITKEILENKNFQQLKVKTEELLNNYLL